MPPGSSITAGTAETVRAANKQSSQKRCTQKIHLHAERRPLWTPEHFRRNLEYTALIPGSINAMQCLAVCLFGFFFFFFSQMHARLYPIIAARRFCRDPHSSLFLFAGCF